MNNRRLQGQVHLRIMAATGPKTLNVCKRYNLVSQEELPDPGRRKPTIIFTSRFTKPFAANRKIWGNLVK